MIIFLESLVILSIKCQFGWETQNQSVGKDMTPTDDLIAVLWEIGFMVLQVQEVHDQDLSQS